MGVRAPRHGHAKQQRETAATELEVNSRLKCLNILCHKGSTSLEANSEAWASLKRHFPSLLSPEFQLTIGAGTW